MSVPTRSVSATSPDSSPQARLSPTKDVPADVLEVLWRNEQVVEYEGPDLEALKYQPVQYVDPATGAIQRNLDEPDNNDPESQARLAGTPGNAHIDPPDEKQVFKDSEEGSLRGMLDPDLKNKAKETK